MRELLFGPQRFSDLRGALPNASSNLIADRLRELEGRGVIQRRKLAPPAGSSVYELTDWGRTLEPILLALGQWGASVPLPSEATLSASSVMLFLRGAVGPLPDPSTVYGLQLDDRTWTVRTMDGEIDVQYGEPANADVVLRTNPQTLNALITEPHALDAALSAATIIVEGNLSALRELIQAATIPAPDVPGSTARSS